MAKWWTNPGTSDHKSEVIDAGGATFNCPAFGARRNATAGPEMSCLAYG